MRGLKELNPMPIIPSLLCGHWVREKQEKEFIREKNSETETSNAKESQTNNGRKGVALSSEPALMPRPARAKVAAEKKK